MHIWGCVGVDAGGQPRQLNFLLAGLLLKKRIVRKALRRFIVRALALRAQILLARLDSLGLADLLEDAGIEEPEEIVIESDLVGVVFIIRVLNQR